MNRSWMCKYLGYTIKDDFTFSHKVSELLNKLSLPSLVVPNHGLNVNFNAIIIPCVDYCFFLLPFIGKSNFSANER